MASKARCPRRCGDEPPRWDAARGRRGRERQEAYECHRSNGRLAGSATRQTPVHVGGACTLSTTTRDAKRCKRFPAGGTVAAVGLFDQFLLPGAIDAGVEGEPRACLLLASCNTLALDPACQAKQQAASAR